jgi:hypothetical protein
MISPPGTVFGIFVAIDDEPSPRLTHRESAQRFKFFCPPSQWRFCFRRRDYSSKISKICEALCKNVFVLCVSCGIINNPSPTGGPVRSMAEPLIEERKYFREHQAEWRKTYPGKFVLVKGNQLIGTFNRPEDAIAEGARRFGTETFLVRSIDQAEEEIYIPALALGILNAGSTQPV